MKTAYIMQKEIRESILTPKGFLWYILTSIILSILSYLFLTNNELSLLDQGQMLYMIMNFITALGILMGLVLGSDAFAGEIERGTMEALLLSPVNNREIAGGKLGSILINWGVIFAISLPYLLVVGKGAQNLLIGIVYLAIIGTLLVIIFSAFSISLSARIKSMKNSLIISFFIFLLAGAPIFLSAVLRKTWFGIILDLINPFADAINTFDSVVIDSQGFSYQIVRVAIICGYTVLSLWFLKRSISKLEM
ncbi:ABC transporter permease [Thermodesulfovibrio yellowstonii]|uniref:Heme exporter protein B, putative n=1 Tax=Thermodesulfovibrio yellowstonii (strain ATCC 51303 / DSM 11347 / YP87) TaxID=289376 RepID=B5YK31_THEYD|nr:ABC transporter permease subunit [Thermodesulfovibrio yellowstonii]ACI21800.1 heme exporter protein B, putative [Thermodesulfovibrio yellowstonii DSM 11347]MDI6865363.1 ABC transporter permease subunit [Thermodesulfovibrio yellowstonii]